MDALPIIAEIAGPSGAGKSTLSSSINAARAGVTAGLTIWHLPTCELALSTAVCSPYLISLVCELKRFRKEELKQIIRLDAFYRMLRYRRQLHKEAAVLLDEGVVFALAKLRADTDGEFLGRYMRHWQEQVIERWASILDAVIWLDASDEVLIERIRTRAKHHRMKGKPFATICEFLKRYRTAYETVLDELASHSGVTIMRFQTDYFEPQAIASEVLGLCSRLQHSEVSTRRVFRPIEVQNEQSIPTSAAGR